MCTFEEWQERLRFGKKKGGGEGSGKLAGNLLKTGKAKDAPKRLKTTRGEDLAFKLPFFSGQS